VGGHDTNDDTVLALIVGSSRGMQMVWTGMRRGRGKVVGSERLRQDMYRYTPHWEGSLRIRTFVYSLLERSSKDLQLIITTKWICPSSTCPVLDRRFHIAQPSLFWLRLRPYRRFACCSISPVHNTAMKAIDLL